MQRIRQPIWHSCFIRCPDSVAPVSPPPRWSAFTLVTSFCGRAHLHLYTDQYGGWLGAFTNCQYTTKKKTLVPPAFQTFSEPEHVHAKQSPPYYFICCFLKCRDANSDLLALFPTSTSLCAQTCVGLIMGVTPNLHWRRLRSRALRDHRLRCLSSSNSY